MRQLFVVGILCSALLEAFSVSAAEHSHLSPAEQERRVWLTVKRGYEEELQQKQGRLTEINDQERNFEVDQAKNVFDTSKNATEGIIKYFRKFGSVFGLFETAKKAEKEIESFQAIGQRNLKQTEFMDADSEINKERSKLRDRIKFLKQNIEACSLYLESREASDRARDRLGAQMEETRVLSAQMVKAVEDIAEERTELKTIKTVLIDQINAATSQSVNAVGQARAKMQQDVARRNGIAQAYGQMDYAMAARDFTLSQSINQFMAGGGGLSTGTGGQSTGGVGGGALPDWGSVINHGVWDQAPPAGRRVNCPENFICNWTSTPDRDWTSMMYWPDEYKRRMTATLIETPRP